MIAECFAISPSMSSVVFRMRAYSSSPKPTDAIDGGHFGTV